MQHKNSRASRIRVVAADDDPIIRELLETKLKQMGCDVLLADDGGQAWEFLRGDKHIDLAIVDLEMPDIDGFTLIKCVRGHPRTKHMPIIVVTSRTDQASIQDAFDSGATSFLTKPLNWSTFDSHIEYLMRLTGATQKARVESQRFKAKLHIKDLIMRRTLTAGRVSTERIRKAVTSLLEDAKNGLDINQVALQLDTIHQTAGEIDDILSNAQNTAHALCSKVDASETRVPVIDLINNTLAITKDRLQSPSIPVALEQIPDDVVVACNADAVSLAVSHLIDNAIRFSPENKQVKLGARILDDGLLTIMISDDGIGMEPEFYASLLDPIDDNERDMQSSANGMGLHVAKAIAEAHGGVLEVRSLPQRGTTTIFVVPSDRVFTEKRNVA